MGYFIISGFMGLISAACIAFDRKKPLYVENWSRAKLQKLLKG